ncbi:hypothetical protein [Brevibacillus borstelensis]|uniref:hypothetical protein n=1 Tax=Brevibacillus TaxID=55080 RepID=UPI0004F360E5|nr:hypothetical protein [Brevibacillus borstelensis]KKX53335.1 hypothetical protein X546_20290 [Brevibacillus borstelensis cifa_chp40]MCM3592665.1 hypothetical protein [Brevibacillus borstelensis]
MFSGSLFLVHTGGHGERKDEFTEYAKIYVESTIYTVIGRKPKLGEGVKMSQTRSIFIICMAGIMMIFAFLGLWESYQPHVGPVGNGPSHQRIWSWFILQFLIAGCFLATGILGLRASRKEREEE